MATTGLWPIKSSLRNVLDYAANPDKTTDKSYLDNDLAAVIEYASADEKTDKKMYVSGINCIPPLALETMNGTKKRFGKEGGNVAYHGYQSFESGEVTAKEAHEIGMETAKRLWGDEYEVLVTTHLNTENIHNHIVVNSVSFKTGKKFKNKISDHRRMREISDEVCREHNKSVIENAPFYKSDKKEYWLHKAGKLTRRDVLRKDIDYAISSSSNMHAFESIMKSMGYRYARGPQYKHPSIKADGWERAIRFDSLGKEYCFDRIPERILEERSSYSAYQIAFRQYHRKPMYEMEKVLRDSKYMSGIQVTLMLFTELLKLVTGNNIGQETPKPLSPELRAACAFLDKYMAQRYLTQKYELETREDVSRFIVEKDEVMQGLYEERKRTDNKIRRCKDPEEKEILQAKRRAISKELKPIRKEFNTAKDILISLPKVEELLQKEYQLEKKLAERKRER